MGKGDGLNHRLLIPTPFRVSDINMVETKSDDDYSEPEFLGGRRCCPKCNAWVHAVNVRGVVICVPLRTLLRRLTNVFVRTETRRHGILRYTSVDTQ